MPITEASAIDSAIEHLHNAKRVHADHNTIVQRLQARQHDLSAQVQSAETAAMTAAAAITPDDGSAARALAELKAQLASNADALALYRAAVTAGEQTVTQAADAVAIAEATDDLREAAELVPAFESAIAGLIAAYTGIEAHIRSARQHASRASRRLDVPHVIGRRLRHVLIAASIDITNDGPALQDRDPATAATAIRDAIENPRWDGF